MLLSLQQEKDAYRELRVHLTNSFDVPVPPAEAWGILTDVERVAPCVPGAELTEVVDARNYAGRVRVKLGPVSLAFEGKAGFVERDDQAHTARLSASGRETRNRGSAQADVRFALEPNAGGTTVSIATDLQLSGPVAQYGRSQGIVAGVAEEMTARFAQCLRENILSGSATPDADVAPPAVAPASGLSIGLGALMRAIRRLFARLFGGMR
jgi:carbon monoxide dehydrogenase subunit G